MSYFPFFVDISDRECLIVGGGKIAYRKACAVLKYGAKVLVVAPEICEEFELLKKEYTVLAQVVLLIQSMLSVFLML